jgi:hypothetical protein
VRFFVPLHPEAQGKKPTDFDFVPTSTLKIGVGDTSLLSSVCGISQFTNQNRLKGRRLLAKATCIGLMDQALLRFVDQRVGVLPIFRRAFERLTSLLSDVTPWLWLPDFLRDQRCAAGPQVVVR